MLQKIFGRWGGPEGSPSTQPQSEKHVLPYLTKWVVDDGLNKVLEISANPAHSLYNQVSSDDFISTFLYPGLQALSDTGYTIKQVVPLVAGDDIRQAGGVGRLLVLVE